MNSTYKYKISLRHSILNGFAAFIFFLMFFFTLWSSINSKTSIALGHIIIIIFSLIICFIFLVIAVFNFVEDLIIFRENRRHPNVDIDDESISLPFEEDKQRVRLLWVDIKECKEKQNSKKKKNESSLNIISKNEGEAYKLFKKNMNASEYEQLKDFLLTQMKLKGKNKIKN